VRLGWSAASWHAIVIRNDLRRRAAGRTVGRDDDAACRRRERRRMAAVARRYVAAVHAEIRERHDGGGGGLAVVAAYTDAIDRLIRYLFENATRDATARNARLKERLTLVAQGGYGRGELNVHSDIDLLILYPWKVTPHIETVTENVLLALIDARLSVGSALRNARECVRLAARDFKVKTALLDARYLCGDEPLYAEFDRAMLSSVWSADQHKFMAEKLCRERGAP
jgi:[protein-PII] uridylyltransferase